MRVAFSPRVLALLYLLVHGGCANVDGGAVELSWNLRAETGAPVTFLGCSNPSLRGVGTVGSIKLTWDVEGDISSRSFPCPDGHGVTKFELPPGDALLSVSPVCDDGRDATAGTYIAPAPVRRTVNIGNTISLGAVELVLQVSCDLQPCICQ